MRIRIANFGRTSSGATTLEFGLILPTFIMILFGATEYARAKWSESVIQQTAAQTARCMGLGLSGCASSGAYSSSLTTSYAQSVATKFGITLPAGAITLNAATSCGGVSGFSQVTLNYTFNSVAPLLLPGLNGGKTLTATACFPNGSV